MPITHFELDVFWDESGWIRAEQLEMFKKDREESKNNQNDLFPTGQ